MEDDDHLAGLLQEVLCDAGLLVARVRDGAAALEAIRVSRPRAIVMDLMMPVMDGWTFLARYREYTSGEDIPTVVVSAAGPEPLSADELGVRAVLPKPFNLGELIETVQDIVGPARHTPWPAAD